MDIGVGIVKVLKTLFILCCISLSPNWHSKSEIYCILKYTSLRPSPPHTCTLTQAQWGIRFDLWPLMSGGRGRVIHHGCCACQISRLAGAVHHCGHGVCVCVCCLGGRVGVKERVLALAWTVLWVRVRACMHFCIWLCLCGALLLECNYVNVSVNVHSGAGEWSWQESQPQLSGGGGDQATTLQGPYS